MRFVFVVLVFCLAYVTAERNIKDGRTFGYNIGNDAIPKFAWVPSTTTVTSTVTATCSQFIPNQAACGRRRRGILFNEDNEDQFPVVPSPVQGVEATQVPSRVSRSADPQHLVMSPLYGFQTKDVQSALYDSNYNYRPILMPYYGSYEQPVIDQRLFFGAWRTVTTTFYTTTTSTYIPQCNSPNLLSQC